MMLWMPACAGERGRAATAFVRRARGLLRPSPVTLRDPFADVRPQLNFLLESLGATGLGAAVFNTDGTMIAENRKFGLVRMRDREAGTQLREAVRAMTASLRRSVAPDGVAVQEIDAGTLACRLRGGVVPNGYCGGEELLLIVLDDAIETSTLRTDRIRAHFGLTLREAQIAYLLADGQSNAAIARQLFISPHTARTHVARVLRKLQCRSRAEVPRVIYGRSSFPGAG